jgi:iron complex outermembrane receptor protein
MYVIADMKAQNNFVVSGKIMDAFDHPLKGATVFCQETGNGAYSDKKGDFSLSLPGHKSCIIQISFFGYETQFDTLRDDNTNKLIYKLKSANLNLREILVTQNSIYSNGKILSIPKDIVSENYLRKYQSGSLMQTLSRLPGIGSLDIGSGQSKPVIRGLAFNRIVVAENGIKHEAQEWGADHGLEIDPFLVEKIEIVKGPVSLMYGSSAIGGVIDMKQASIPGENSSGGDIRLNYQSNNDLTGFSAGFFHRKNKLYIKGHFTYTDYADFRVPVDSIEYMTYYFRLKNNRIRNSAGKERNGSLMIGYIHDNLSSHISVSNNFNKSGFFANAHGLEIRNSAIDFDASNRDIDLPSQQVNHLKVLSNSLFLIKDYKINLDLGYQHNYRQEFSEAVEHGYMPLPPDSLERLYDKSTLTSSVKLSFPTHDHHTLTTGIQHEYQNNKTGGWGFILPDYTTTTVGAYLHDNIKLTKSWQINAGLRYDWGYLHTKPYFDWYKTPVSANSSQNIQRAFNLKRYYNNFSWGFGTNIQSGKLSWQINAGKSFRMPTAKEIASNGINYHMYRYEKGDTSLVAEESYQLDFGITLKSAKWKAAITPFINYFPNYIYMNPTAEYQEAQQVYYYSQSQVFRSGGELSASYQINKSWNLAADLEYIYSIQLSGKKRGYTLPFSPPLTINTELEFAPESTGFLKKPVVAIHLKAVGNQNNIVPPERTTPGYVTVNMRGGFEVQILKQTINFSAQLVNIFNTVYYDHNSFYRIIGIPGTGRNMIVNVQIPINKK